MDHQMTLEQAMITVCPARTEAATLEDWHALTERFFPEMPALEDFRLLADSLADRAVIRKRGNRYFDPQKTTSF